MGRLLAKKRNRKLGRYLLSLVGFFMFVSILLTLSLRWIDPPTTAFVVRDDNANYWWLGRNWVDYHSVSPEVFLAIIASEDQKFPRHAGFDFQSIKKSLFERRAKVRGASTITQQLVKNLYLWPGRSLFRKGVEAWLTLWVELFLPKQRILEIYVNVVEFGPGTYGLGKASKAYFKQSPKTLSRYQASLLAAVLPSPKKRFVSKLSAYVLKRSTDIRASMRSLGGVAYLKSM